MDAQVTPLPERIDARERELGTAADQLRTQIDELAARLRELDEELGNLAVTRRIPRPTPDGSGSGRSAIGPVGPPAYQQILGAFADAAGPMRARDLCERFDLAVMPKNIESTRHKLKRLVSLGVLAEREPGVFARRRP